LTISLLALYYQDKLSIKWSSRDLYHFIEASNFQSMCEYDYDNLSMEQDDYLNQKNRFEQYLDYVDCWNKYRSKYIVHGSSRKFIHEDLSNMKALHELICDIIWHESFLPSLDLS